MSRKTTVSIGYGESRIEAVRVAFDHLGGISKWVKPGMKVLLKPNVMSPQGTPYTTHIDMLKGLYILCREAGAEEVMVGENSVCGMPPRKMFEFRGLTDALTRLGIKVIFFDEEPWVYRMNMKNFCLKDMHIPKSLAEADVWISVPVAKTHEACTTTLGLKNNHGILPDEDKARHHRGRPEAGTSLWEKFVDIYAVAKPTLCVTDMFHAVEGDGPAFGDIVEMKLVVASEDTVACDSVVEKLMGFELQETPLTLIAHRRGLGMGDMEGINVVGEKIERHQRKFARAVWHPDGDSPRGMEMLVGDVCHGGCQMLLRYLIDSSKIVWEKDEKEFGKIYIMCGDHPPPPPEDRFILVFGDCAIYSTWHYSYRRKPKQIGPWWRRRPAYADVPGCCPLQLAWLKGFANLVAGYAPLSEMTAGVEVIEAEEYSFAEGVPLEKNPRRWTWDAEFGARYAREIAASNPPPYIYGHHESVKGDRLKGQDPLKLDRVKPPDLEEVQTVESYGEFYKKSQRHRHGKS